MTDCQVCCEPFNKMTRFPVKCINQCDLKVCRKCVDTYIVSNSPQEPVCMTCKHVWTEDFLDTQMTKSFMTKKLKPLLAQRLFEVEQMRFPETQENLVRKREIARLQPISRQALNDFRIAEKALNRVAKYSGINLETITPDRWAELGTNKTLAWRKWADIDMKLRELGASTNKKRVSEYKMGCVRENCRGFLNQSWVCGICELKTCKDCHEPHDENHECDPGKIETVKLLKKDSKPCPKCSCFITKIAGCDHMWCTNCNTGFSWRTGALTNARNQTNPLYYEFMRRTAGQVPRNAGDVPICQQDINVGFLQNQLGNISKPYAEQVKWVRDAPAMHSVRTIEREHSVHYEKMQLVTEKLWSYFQVYRHVINLELGHGVFSQTESDNVDIREKFITNQMTKVSFMSTLHQRSNLHKKHVKLHNILQTWSNVVGEHLRTFMNETLSTTIQVPPDEHAAIKRLEQLENITNFTNEQFAKIKAKYTFGVIHHRESHRKGCITWKQPGQTEGRERFRPSAFIR
jgi:hypothetical protein